MDLYHVLGLTRGATKDEIKKAFRALAHKCHPDRFANAPEHEQERAVRQFRDIKEAYEVLSDDTKRQTYHTRGSTSGAAGYNASAQYESYNMRYNAGARRQHYQRTRYTDFFQMLARNMTRADALFHAALAGTLIGGVWLFGGVGDSLWRQHNRGKLFEDVVRSRREAQQAQQAQQARQQGGGLAQEREGVHRRLQREHGPTEQPVAPTRAAAAVAAAAAAPAATVGVAATEGPPTTHADASCNSGGGSGSGSDSRCSPSEEEVEARGSPSAARASSSATPAAGEVQQQQQQHDQQKEVEEEDQEGWQLVDVELGTSPGEGAPSPGGGASSPGEGAPSPGEGVSSPGEEAPSPGEGAQQQATPGGRTTADEAAASVLHAADAVKQHRQH